MTTWVKNPIPRSASDKLYLARTRRRQAPGHALLHLWLCPATPTARRLTGGWREQPAGGPPLTTLAGTGPQAKRQWMTAADASQLSRAGRSHEPAGQPDDPGQDHDQQASGQPRDEADRPVEQ